MISNYLMWLAHALPAVALTITAPVTPSPTPVSCGTDLIRGGSFVGVDPNDGPWDIVGCEPGAVVDNYLHLSARAVNAVSLLIQEGSNAVAGKSYTFSIDFRQNSGDDECSLEINLAGKNIDTSSHTASENWTTISKQWTATGSSSDVVIVIACDGEDDIGSTVDVTNIRLVENCDTSSLTSVSPPVKTPSIPPVSSTPVASVSPSAVSSSQAGTTAITEPVASPSSSAVQSSDTAQSSNTSHSSGVTASTTSGSSESLAGTTCTDSTSTTHAESAFETTESTTKEMTTSTVFTTRTATITACPSTVTDCPATQQTTYTTTETIVVSTTVCPIADVTTTIDGSHATGPAGVDTGSNPGSGTDHTISTIFSTRTVTLTECPATVTDCPARDKTTHVATETVVAGTTSVPINTVPATAPVVIQSSSVPVQTTTVIVGTETRTSTIYSVLTVIRSSTTEKSAVETGVSHLVETTYISSGASDSLVLSNDTEVKPETRGTTATSSATPSLVRAASSTALVSSIGVPSSVPGRKAGAANPSGLIGTSVVTTGATASTSPVYNGASSRSMSGVVSAVGAIAALVLFL